MLTRSCRVGLAGIAFGSLPPLRNRLFVLICLRFVSRRPVLHNTTVPLDVVALVLTTLLDQKCSAAIRL
jgi:hypothetical protein